MAIRHVYPLNDLYEHNTEGGGQCDCAPTVEFLESGDVVVIHNSRDGRELFEEMDNGKAG